MYIYIYIYIYICIYIYIYKYKYIHLYRVNLSSLCVCARVLFVYKPSENTNIRLSRTYMLNTRNAKKSVFYSCLACLINTITLHMYVSVSCTGLHRRNTTFVFAWLRHRNTWIPIQHVGPGTSQAGPTITDSSIALTRSDQLSVLVCSCPLCI